MAHSWTVANRHHRRAASSARNTMMHRFDEEKLELLVAAQYVVWGLRQVRKRWLDQHDDYIIGALGA